MASQKRFRGIATALFLLTAIGISLLWQARAAAALFTTNYSFYDKVTAGDGEADDRFGSAIAVSEDGNTVVVGAATDDPGVTQDHGSVHIYMRQAGTAVFQQQLLASGNNVQRLGTSVAISGDTIAAGSPGDDGDTGAVYIFVKTGGNWVQTQRLAANDAAANDFFGQSVSLNGNSIVVGANGDANNRGSAYVFVRAGNTWNQQGKLIANDGTGSDAFGLAVAISGDTVAVGAPGADAGGINDRGAVYLFARNGSNWLQQQKLVVADAGIGDNFGRSVALDGSTVIAGAFLDSSFLYSGHGSAYVFTRTGTVWSAQDKLGADDPANNDLFGNAVALSGDTAIIGAYTKQVGNIASTGRIYVFTRAGTNWSKQQDFTTSNQSGALFGASVAFANDTIAVGAPRESAHKGAAYIYRPLNHAPTLTVAGPLNLLAGDGITNDISIATISDQDQTAQTLQMTVNGGANATSNGVTINNLSIGANGAVSATLQISCTAADAHFTLRATDDEGDFVQALLVINIGANTAPALSYSAQTINLGGTLSVLPTTGPSDNGGIASLQTAGITPSTFSGTFTVLNPQTGFVQIHANGPAGTYTATVRATDNCGLIRNATFTFNVTGNCPTITMNPSGLSNGTAGSSYSQQFTASGGSGPYSYAINGGSLPNGLTLSAAGLLSGLPTAVGTFNFTIKATDANGCFGTRAYTVTVAGVVVNNGLQFYPLSRPVRLLDTRAGQGNCDNISAPINSGTSLTTLARTTCEGIAIPPDAQAVVGNLTIINQSAQSGYLTIYPDGQAAPLAANMIYEPGGILANN
ncbi:MAG: putative Ig domain-containing protein, partial [Acidobacteriota bacterium]